MRLVESAAKTALLLAAAIVSGAGLAANTEKLNASSFTPVDEYTLKGSVDLINGIPLKTPDGYLNAVVEIPKGSTAKWEVDEDNPKNLIWKIKRGKPKVYDFMGGYVVNYGFIPRTLMPLSIGGEEEPLDAIIVGKAIPRGTVVKVKPLGFLHLIDKGEFDGKLLVAVVGSKAGKYPSWQALNSWRIGTIDAILAWFGRYKGPGKVRVTGIQSVEEAEKIIDISAKAYIEEQKD